MDLIIRKRFPTHSESENNSPLTLANLVKLAKISYLSSK